MVDEPTEHDARLYMEICAALMTAFGQTEVEIDLNDVPDEPFQLWRKMDEGKLIVRLVWEESQASIQTS